MTRQTRVLLLVVIARIAVVIIEADDSRRQQRDLAPLIADSVAPFREHRPRGGFLLDLPLTDKIIDQRGTSTAITARDHSIQGWRAPRVFSKEGHNGLSSPLGPPIHHRQPFKRTPFAALNNDYPLLARNQEKPRGQRSLLRGNDNPIDGPGESLLASAELLRGFSPRKNRPFTGASSGTSFHGRSPPSGEPLSFQKQAALLLENHLSLPDSVGFHRDDLYGKPPIDSYGWQRDRAQPSPYEEEQGGPPVHTRYDSDVFKQPATVPMIWPSGDQLPLNAEISAKPSSLSLGVAIDEPGFSVSPGVTFGGDDDDVHSSDTFRMKLGPITLLDPAAPMRPDGNCNALVDSSASVSGGAAATTIAAIVPSISVSANRSSILGHILTSLPAKPGLPATATATPIKPFAGNTLGPIYFHATRYGGLVTPSVSVASGSGRSGAGSSVYSALAQPATAGFNSEERGVKYLVPEVAANNAKAAEEARSLMIPRYVLGGPGHIRNSLANYGPPEGLGYYYDWSPQRQSSDDGKPDAGKPALVLPGVPGSVLPISQTLPWLSVTSDAISATRAGSGQGIPLGLVDVPSHLTASIPGGLASGVCDSITSGGIPGAAISTATWTGDGMASMPALSLGRSLHCAEQQLQRTREARGSWYPAGIYGSLPKSLQLQLGGFGGINYNVTYE